MRQHSASAIIIGGGIIGAAIFERLSSVFPKSVVLTEKNQLASGATGKSAGIARSYDPAGGHHPFDAYQKLLGARDEDMGTRLVTFHIAPRPSTQFSVSEVLCPSTAKRYPSIRIGRDEVAWIEKSSGYYDPKAVTRALVERGQSRGGIVMENTEALNLLVEDHKVVGIRTSRGALRASTVVLATGAWTEKISQRWSLDLPVFAKGIQMNRYTGIGDTPEAPIFIDEALNLYGRGDGPNAILVGMPMAQERVDPDIQPAIDPGHKEETSIQARKRFAWGDGVTLHSAIAGFDAYTESGESVVRRHSSIPNLYIATGFSGGGFKQAPQVARTVCELVCEDIIRGDICA